MIAERVLAGEVIDEQALMEFVRSRRWFGSKAEEITNVQLLDGVVVRSQPPLLIASVAEVRFHAGTHELYQLLLGLRDGSDDRPGDVISVSHDSVVAYEALGDPLLARELVHLMRGEATIRGDESAVEFRPVDLGGYGPDLSEARPLTAEQSNTSVVFGEELILKAYRRLEPGINPELEVLRFLTDLGYPNIAALAGWYSYSGRVMDATLGILQAFVPGARDGWDLALEEIATAPDRFLARLRRLGEVTGELHRALASDSLHPDFAPEEPSSESLALLVATVDEEIERIFLELPPEDERLAPILGRGEEVRERLRTISHVGPLGRVIRTHGDYHLGQVLWSNDDWVVLDFEGEPARSLAERRRKRSPLRDVAGMLRSFAYAASAVDQAPPEWEDRARKEFLSGYFEYVEPSIVPPAGEGRDRLLEVFELEKAVYELRYELNHRPDWIEIPVSGIARLLES
jgi:trehalose synthase-fused probable maltokinase